MTVSASIPTIRYTYTGPGDYTFPYKVFKTTDIEVLYRDSAGLVTSLSNGVDFTVALVDGVDGGTCTLISPVLPGYIDITRVLPITQEVDWVNNDAFDMEVLEDSMDRQVMILQQFDAILTAGLIVTSWKGDWVSGEPYVLQDIVVAATGNWYICVTSHTAGDFATDLAAGYWALGLDVTYLEDLTSLAAQSEAAALVSANNASSSETNAAESEGNAADSEANSALSENNAANCASEAYDSAVASAASAAEAAGLVIVGNRSDAINTNYYVATAGQVNFTITQPNAEDNIFVFMNSRKLRLTEDYTLNSAVSASVMTLDSGAAVGDEIDIISINTYDLTGAHDDLEAAVAAAEAAQAAAEAARDSALTIEADVIAQGTTQVNRVIAEGNTQVARVTAEGTTQIALATAQADRAESEANAAAASAATASTQATNAAASAVQSSGFADNAYDYAQDALSVVTQDLSAISKALSLSTTAVAIFRGDVADDSDPTWIERCQTTSWYNEPLNTATRGKTRKFPSKYLIAAEATKVTIFDTTDPDVPMWMVFNSGGSGSNFNFIGAPFVTGVSMLNGKLIGIGYGIGTFEIDFLSDTAISRYTVGLFQFYPNTISSRNDRPLRTSVADATKAIVNNNVNSVAMTVLPDAPYDQTTGLPVPTIAVATDGGVSVIDGPAGVGTVVDGIPTLLNSVSIDSNGTIFLSRKLSNTSYLYRQEMLTADNTPAYTQYYDGIAPALLPPVLGEWVNGSAVNGSSIMVAQPRGLTLLKENPISPTDGMVAHITSEYNTGWMKGDIRLATLADTETGTIGTDITTELITNGTFDTDGINPVGWDTSLNSGGAVVTVISGEANFTRDAGATAISSLNQGFSTVVGTVYILSFYRAVGLTVSLRLSTSSGGVPFVDMGTVDGDQSISFMAESTTTWVRFFPGGTGTCVMDNISVKAVQNLVENGEFSSDRGWSFSAGSVTITGGQAVWTASNAYMSQGFVMEAGKTYAIETELASISGTGYNVLYSIAEGLQIGPDMTAPDVYKTIYTPSVATDITITVLGGTVTSAINYITIEELQVPDRCVKNNPLQVIGQLTRAPVATGSDLQAISGFSASNYIEQPYSSDLDFGTGDFNALVGIKMLDNATDEVIFERDSPTTAQRITGQVNANGTVSFICDDGTTVRTATSTGTIHSIRNWTNTGDLSGATKVDSLLEVSGTLYAGTQPYGDVFKSIDGGTTWTNTGNLSGATHVFSLIEVSGTLYAGTYPSGNVFKSVDGGTNWTNTGDLSGASYVFSLLEVSGTLYAGTGLGGDVFKSVDGGTNWTNTGDLLGATRVDSLLEVSGTLYAGTHPNGDVFKSVDGGTTWTNTGDLSGATYVFSLLEVSGTLYAGTSTNGDVFKSVDGGTTWTNTGDLLGASYVFSLTEVSGTLYAGTQPNGDVFKSVDGGTNWTNTGDLLGATRVDSLIEVSGTLYAGTQPNGDVFKSVDDRTTHEVAFDYSSGTLNISIDGVADGTATGAALLTMSNPSAILRLGLDAQGANPLSNGALTLLRIGAGVPSAEQILDIYNNEKKLFEEYSLCTLHGDDVDALDYDSLTDTLTVINAGGLYADYFNGLKRQNSYSQFATPVNAVSTLKGSAGYGYTNGALYTEPAKNLREELEEPTVNHQELVPFVTAGAGQTAVQVPLGYEPVLLYDAGLFEIFTVTTDGYYKYANISASTGDVTIMARRI